MSSERSKVGFYVGPILSWDLIFYGDWWVMISYQRVRVEHLILMASLIEMHRQMGPQ